MTQTEGLGVAPGSIPKASLTEKPPAQLNVKPVQLSLQPQIGGQQNAGAMPSSPKHTTSQPPAIGQPLAMPKIEPIKP